MIVLGSLMGAMTLTSGLLLVLEPGPMAPLSEMTLQSVDRASEPEDRLFDVADVRDWQAIVIHDSGTLEGSSKSINALHEDLGRGGLGYHFVITNERAADGPQIEVGFRWKRQFVGAYLEGEGSEWYNRKAIGICLVGDSDRQAMSEDQMRELVWLVQQLQRELNIPRERVVVQVGAGQPGEARYFPHLWFDQQLLDFQVR